MLLHLTVEECKNELKFHAAEFRFAYWSDGNKLGFVITATILYIYYYQKWNPVIFLVKHIFILLNKEYLWKSKQHLKVTSMCGFPYWTE